MTLVKLRARNNEEGATAVEYGIMVALIAVVIITAVAILGGNLSEMFSDVSDEVGCEERDDEGECTD